ncbi:phosphonate ABC transporter ATP-binding protein [Secundilactobacillus kimchicus]|uniref:phosphonate ABC transporter ATP-binding protein n=1 Tax=Secundilactobacillus kimchicus TaxID=528209 RepID=UPI001C010E00|nr:phosphonate ABC transporter ATP-binding protein [Secundilactobacillus kimchicus]MBT9672143.1 phosphonate ABC transporter ATP-binding protein [Secundilactobacillus kimchicus]
MIQVTNLTKHYSADKASLADVSVTFQPGEVTAIIGPSGAGKTTLLRSLNQLIRDDLGTILFNDQDVRQLNRRGLKQVRRKIGMVFQNYNLIEPLTAIENVLHGRLGEKGTLAGMLSLYSQDEKDQALGLLSEVGLGDFCYQRCHDLSGGQKQRVGIARALMQAPDVLLCDEPIASLDPKSAMVVMDILSRLARTKKMTVIVNLHQVDVARTYADHIVGINQGRVAFDAPVSALDDWAVTQIYR